MIASFAGARFLGSIRELSLVNVNKAGVTSLAGVTFDLELGDSDWVCSGLVPGSECALPGNGSLIAGYETPCLKSTSFATEPSPSMRFSRLTSAPHLHDKPSQSAGHA